MIQELYKFERYINAGDASPSVVVTYTSGDSSVTYESRTYSTKIMGHDPISHRVESIRTKAVVNFPLGDDFAVYWREECQNSTLILTLIEKDDTTYRTVFKGKLHQIIISSKIGLSFESDYSLLQRIGTGRVNQRLCQHTLYSQEPFNCGVTMAAYAVAGTVTSISGTNVEVWQAAGYDDHYFTFGILKDAEGNYNYISSHIGDTLVIERISQDLIDDYTDDGSADVTIYPGCFKNRDVCNDKFDNVDNFGGSPWIPADNPWDKKVIF